MERLSSRITLAYKIAQLFVSMVLIVVGASLAVSQKTIGGGVALGLAGVALVCHFWFFVRNLKHVYLSGGEVQFSSRHETSSVRCEQILKVAKSLTLRFPCLRVEYRGEDGSPKDFRFIPSLRENGWTHWGEGKIERLLKNSRNTSGLDS